MVFKSKSCILLSCGPSADTVDARGQEHPRIEKRLRVHSLSTAISDSQGQILASVSKPKSFQALEMFRIRKHEDARGQHRLRIEKRLRVHALLAFNPKHKTQNAKP